MIVRFLVCLLALSSFAAGQVQLEFGSPAASYTQVLQLPNGDRLLVGSSQQQITSGLYSFNCCAISQHSQITLTALGSAPFRDQPPYITPFLGGSGNDIPQAAAVGPSGNIWIVGNTDSDDFDLVNPIVSQKVPYRTAGFVMELDPTGNNLLLATYLAGKQPSSLLFATFATAITIDSAGNVYVGGNTNETDFPTTPGAFLSGKGGADSLMNTFLYSFLVKISPAGKLVYSTLLTTGSSACVGGSQCIGQQSTSATVSSLAVDSSGTAAVAGITDGSYNSPSGYVCRVAADGSNLLWKAAVPITYGAVTSLLMAPDNAFAPLNATGNLDLFGQYAIVGIEPIKGLFAAQMKADGSGLTYSEDLGQSADANAFGLLVDGLGNVYLAGMDASSQLYPATASVPPAGNGADFILKLDRFGSPVQAPLSLPEGAITGPPAFDGNGNLLLPGTGSSLLTVPGSYYGAGAPAVVAFANAASYALNTGFYPGALLTLYGFGLPSLAQGLKVSVQGAPTPIVYAGPNQINIQVPFETPFYPSPASVQLVSASGTITVPAPVSESLGLFTTDGTYAAALNQDGTVNLEANPASAGSVVALFGTGAVWPVGLQDGAAASAAMPLAAEINKFEALSSDGTPLNIEYVGSAPGMIDGVFQVNVQLPASIYVPPHTYAVQLRSTPVAVNALAPRTGTLSSNVVLIYVKSY